MMNEDELQPAFMTEEELLAAFTGEIINEPRVALVLTVPGREEDSLALSPETAWMLIGQLQLALRHPSNQGLSRQKTEGILEWLRMMLAPSETARAEVFDRGGNPEFDK